MHDPDTKAAVGYLALAVTTAILAAIFAFPAPGHRSAMRNDLLDEMDNVPSLKPERDDRPLSRRPTDGDDEPYREPVGHARPARRGPSSRS